MKTGKKIFLGPLAVLLAGLTLGVTPAQAQGRDNGPAIVLGGALLGLAFGHGHNAGDALKGGALAYGAKQLVGSGSRHNRDRRDDDDRYGFYGRRQYERTYQENTVVVVPAYQPNYYRPYQEAGALTEGRQPATCPQQDTRVSGFDRNGNPYSMRIIR